MLYAAGDFPICGSPTPQLLQTHKAGTIFYDLYVAEVAIVYYSQML